MIPLDATLIQVDVDDGILGREPMWDNASLRSAAFNPVLLIWTCTSKDVPFPNGFKEEIGDLLQMRGILELTKKTD